MAYIGKKPEDVIQGNASYDSFTGDGSTTAYDVTNILPDGGQFDVEVFVDNVRQEAGSSKSYTIGVDGSGDRKRINFNVAPDSGSEIYVINPGRETSVITVADNTLSAAKIQSDAVTTAKILDSNVTTAKIAADAITGAKLADDAVDSEHLTDGSVDNVHLSGSIANAKLANSSITINGTAVSLGGSVTAGTDWQATVVADGSTQLTAVAGKGYFLDTNAGVIEVFLPASPSRGDTIVLADYAGHFALNNVLVNAGTNLIDSVETAGAGQGYKLTTNNLVVELVYVDSTKGWLVQENEAKNSLTASTDTNAQYVAATGGTVTTTGDYKIHAFTGDGCFVVSNAGNDSGSNYVDYLVVGGGGSANDTGAGGGGGFRESRNPASATDWTASPLVSTTSLSLPVATYPVTVGASNSNSSVSTITSAAGGAGAHGSNGEPGGSGGGAGYQSGTGGTGNTPPVSPPQGNNGGNAPAPQGNPFRGAGGGGAGGTGGNQPGGAGGAGVTTHISGTPTAYSGGGGGAGTSGAGGAGGTGGGGASGSHPSQNGVQGAAGTSNTGGGGGSASGLPQRGQGGAGGKGIVILRYKFQTS